MTPEEFKKAKLKLGKLDPALKELFARHRGLKFLPEKKRPTFESLVRAIAHQQLHGKAAETILGRMIALFPKQKFPKPEQLLKTKPETLRACGFSFNKIKAIHDICTKTIDGVVPSEKVIHKISNEEIIERLTSIYGVGKWTVEMMLIFQMGRPDVWPVDDFGIRKGYQVFKNKKSFPKPKALKKDGELWSPYQTVVALHLWREADLAKK